MLLFFFVFLFFVLSRSLFLFRSSVFARTPLLLFFSTIIFFIFLTFSSFLLTSANLHVSSKLFYIYIVLSIILRTFPLVFPPSCNIISRKNIIDKLSPNLQHFFMSLNRRCSFLPSRDAIFLLYLRMLFFFRRSPIIIHSTEHEKRVSTLP